MTNTMSKYNKVQQLFIAITGCNPEKDVFQVSEQFKEFCMGEDLPTVVSVWDFIDKLAPRFQRPDLSRYECTHLSHMIAKLAVMIKEHSRGYPALVSNFRQQFNKEGEFI